VGGWERMAVGPAEDMKVVDMFDISGHLWVEVLIHLDFEMMVLV
jgi:hypothetical protein